MHNYVCSHTRCKTVRKKFLNLHPNLGWTEVLSRRYILQPTNHPVEEEPFWEGVVEKSASKMSPKNVKNFGCRCCLLFLCFSFKKIGKNLLGFWNSWVWRHSEWALSYIFHWISCIFCRGKVATRHTYGGDLLRNEAASKTSLPICWWPRSTTMLLQQ